MTPEERELARIKNILIRCEDMFAKVLESVGEEEFDMDKEALDERLADDWSPFCLFLEEILTDHPDNFRDWIMTHLRYRGLR